MPLGEAFVRRTAKSPRGYAAKVRALAAVYALLTTVSVATIAMSRSLDAHECQTLVISLLRPPSSAPLSPDDVELRVAAQYPIE
jgi:hypothetical protein